MTSQKEFQFATKANSIDRLYDDDGIMIVSIDLMHEDDTNEDCNNNHCNISHECIVKSIDTIFNKSISCLYNSISKDFVTGIKEHFYDENEQFQTHIIGHIPSDARWQFIKRDNGKTYLNVEAVIDKYIEPQIAEILKDNNGQLKVSVVFSAVGEQNDNGIFYVESFILRTVTLLSPEVKEGIEGSNLKVMKFSEQRARDLDNAYSNFAHTNSTSDIFTEIKNKKIKNKKEETLVSSLGTRELERRLWSALKDYKYRDGSWEGQRYWIYEILTESKEVIVHDNQTDEYYKIPYRISKDGDVTVKETERKKVVEDKTYREVNNALMFAKEDMGKGSKIEIDKSKDAMSDDEWGKVNKVDLRNKVMDASNKDELVKAVYLKVEDGWEDAPSEKLKYPVMQIKGGKAVYNRYGLASALAYAKAENDDSVVGKVMKLYKDLDIEHKEVDNCVECDCEEVKNADSQPDMMVKENSCEEDWENKYNELKNNYDEMEKKYAELETELKTYRRKEDIEAMRSYLNTYKKAFADNSEYEVMAAKIENLSRGEFEKIVDDKVKEWVQKMSCATDNSNKSEDVEVRNSLHIMRKFETITTPPEIKNIDDALDFMNKNKK